MNIIIVNFTLQEYTLNQPEVWWLNGDQGSVASVGGVIRVSSFNALPLPL